MKLAIIGSRDFTDYELFRKTLLARYCHVCPDWGTYIAEVREVISGGARGADQMAAKWVKWYNGTTRDHIKLTEFIPDWQLGKHAGFLRNEQIIHAADEVLAFWNGVSRGTQHSLGLAKKTKKNTVVIYF